MKAVTYKQRKEKWESKNLSYRVNAAREAAIVLTAENAVKLLGKETKGRMIDIGCGFGEIDILLAEKTQFSIMGCDISEKAVQIGHARVSGGF